MTDRKYLQGAYDLATPEDAKNLYDAWAASYDAEITENGYATPRRCAEALAGAAKDLTAPVLDIGCGTGLSGVALRAAGFAIVDGTDLSEGMLEQARARQSVYRVLTKTEIDDPLPFQHGAYANMSAAGVISPQHAPAETVDLALDRLPRDGCLVFSLNDHAMEDPAFPAKVEEVVAAGTADLLLREHGPHLPGIGLDATVYVLRKR